MKLIYKYIYSILSLLCLLGASLETFLRYPALPEQIITRYTLSGALGSSGSKRMLLVLLLMMWALFGVMAVFEMIPRLAKRSLGSEEGKLSTSEKSKLERNISSGLGLMRLLILALLWWMLHASLGQEALGRAYIFLFLLAITLPLLGIIIRSYRQH